MKSGDRSVAGQRLRSRLIIVTVALGSAGCATPPLRVEPAYFNEAAYADWDCDRINRELVFITDRVMTQSSQQAARREALFLGNEVAPLLSELKGKREALVRISTAKSCVLSQGAALQSQ